MSAPITKTRFAFELPNQTYVDARFEEPNLYAARPAAAPRGFGAWLAHRVAAFRAWQEKQVAMAELSGMTDRELLDIGISRADLQRAFEPAFNADLVTRSGS